LQASDTLGRDERKSRKASTFPEVPKSFALQQSAQGAAIADICGDHPGDLLQPGQKSDGMTRTEMRRPTNSGTRIGSFANSLRRSRSTGRCFGISSAEKLGLGRTATRAFGGRSGSIGVRCWRGATPGFSQPSERTEETFIEAFNGRFRSEWLKTPSFSTLADTREKRENRIEYEDDVRPIRAIGAPPAIS
jgi:hypothetical protein